MVTTEGKRQPSTCGPAGESARLQGVGPVTVTSDYTAASLEIIKGPNMEVELKKKKNCLYSSLQSENCSEIRKVVGVEGQSYPFQDGLLIGMRLR